MDGNAGNGSSAGSAAKEGMAGKLMAATLIGDLLLCRDAAWASAATCSMLTGSASVGMGADVARGATGGHGVAASGCSNAPVVEAVIWLNGNCPTASGAGTTTFAERASKCPTPFQMPKKEATARVDVTALIRFEKRFLPGRA